MSTFLRLEKSSDIFLTLSAIFLDLDLALVKFSLETMTRVHHFSRPAFRDRRCCLVVPGLDLETWTGNAEAFLPQPPLVLAAAFNLLTGLR